MMKRDQRPPDTSNWKMIKKVPASISLLHNARVVARFMDPAMDQPSGDFVHKNALYFGRSNLAAIITKQPPFRNRLHSELIWASPQEVRLMGAIVLSVRDEEGMTRFGPLTDHFLIDVSPHADLSSHRMVKAIEEKLVYGVIANQFIHPQGFKLSHPHNSATQAIRSRLYRAIDSRDAVAIRGLYAMLKAGHLCSAHDFAFQEEACMNIQIAREAALEMIRRSIAVKKGRQASFGDAHEYIRANLDRGDSLAEYLQDQHHLWIAMKHPNPSSGARWHPGGMADDYYETHMTVVRIYRHIYLGEN